MRSIARSMIEKRSFYKVRVEDEKRVGDGDRESWKTGREDSDLLLLGMLVRSGACIRRY